MRPNGRDYRKAGKELDGSVFLERLSFPDPMLRDAVIKVAILSILELSCQRHEQVDMRKQRKLRSSIRFVSHEEHLAKILRNSRISQ